MPFLSPKRRVSDAENKLRLLLCLRALGMATSDQLWPFVAELELMEYLPYCLLLDELKKDGEVAQGRCALEGVLYPAANSPVRRCGTSSRPRTAVAAGRRRPPMPPD